MLNKSTRPHLQSYDVPVESSNLGNMDGEGDVVQDEWVDVVVPDNNKTMLWRKGMSIMDKYSPL